MSKMIWMFLCSQVLPKSIDETSIVQVKLMRRMRYSSPYLHETIRPLKVHQAAKYLVNTELYQAENVALCDDWRIHEKGINLDKQMFYAIDNLTIFFTFNLGDTLDFIIPNNVTTAQEDRRETVNEENDSSGNSLFNLNNLNNKRQISRKQNVSFHR